MTCFQGMIQQDQNRVIMSQQVVQRVVIILVVLVVRGSTVQHLDEDSLSMLAQYLDSTKSL